MAYRPDICIYHAPCQDGFSAAWATWLRWPGTIFVPGVYGEPPPAVAGAHVLLLDFSYKRPVLELMSETAATITVLDHHKSAQADLETFAILNGVSANDIEEMVATTQPGLGNIRAQFDMTHSGAVLAWQFAFPGTRRPTLLTHVEDRDLWRFQVDGTREICADLFSRPYTFEEWSRAASDLDTPLGWTSRLNMGAAIERKHHKDCAELLGLCRREMVIGGHRVLVANIPYTMSSDAAHTLAEGRPFGACYYDRADGGRVFSLRSAAGGVDVSKIAVRYGGGGHASAAGFSAPAGWEGDLEVDPDGVR